MNWKGGQFGHFPWTLKDCPPAKFYPSIPCRRQAQTGSVGWVMDIIVESDDEEEGKKDGHGIYSDAEGPSAQGPINRLLTVCQGKQSLITPAVVFMLPAASALHHLFGFALQ